MDSPLNKIHTIVFGWSLLFFLMMGFFTYSQGPSEAENLYQKLQSENELFYQLLFPDNFVELNQKIEADPSQHIPPVLFAWSNQLYRNGLESEAVFWYNVAQIRLLTDLEMKEGFLDISKRKIAELYASLFGEPIERHIGSDVDYNKDIIRCAIEHVKEHPSHYPRWWIYLDGAEKLSDINQLKELDLPAHQEKMVQNKVVREFEKRFNRWVRSEQ